MYPSKSLRILNRMSIVGMVIHAIFGVVTPLTRIWAFNSLTVTDFLNPQPNHYEVLMEAHSYCWSGFFISLVFTMICFLAWQTKTLNHLRKWDKQNTYQHPMLSILGWFIPVANLFLPPALMRTLFKGVLQYASNDIQQKMKRKSGFISLWWMGWVIAVGSTMITNSYIENPNVIMLIITSGGYFLATLSGAIVLQALHVGSQMHDDEQ